MPESQHVEYKQSWQDDHLRWICGFANAEGGVLQIGRDDRGQVVGVKNAGKLMEDLPNKVRDILGLIIEVNRREKDGGHYLEIVVEPCSNPVSYKGRYFRRSGSTLQELKGAALDRFILRKQGKHWDSVPLSSLDEEGLSDVAIKLFKSQAAKSGRMPDTILAETKVDLLQSLNLSENEQYNRAAALLFAETPERWIPGAWVKIGFFVTDDDLRYQDEVHGSLIEQVGKVMDLLLTKYLKAYIHYEGIQRVERFLFPEEALREAVLNAIIHKDYSSGVPIQISVYDDKLVIWNSGQLPEQWTLQDFYGKHPSSPFNPIVANAFFRAGFIESWGRGIEKSARPASATR